MKLFRDAHADDRPHFDVRGEWMLQGSVRSTPTFLPPHHKTSQLPHVVLASKLRLPKETRGCLSLVPGEAAEDKASWQDDITHENDNKHLWIPAMCRAPTVPSPSDVLPHLIFQWLEVSVPLELPF